MKKAIILTVALSGMSTQAQEVGFNKITNLEKLIREKNLDTTLMQQLVTSTNSLETVVIRQTTENEDDDFLDDLVEGTTKNSDLHYKTINGKIFLSLETISTITLKAEWLEKYADKIDYEATAKYAINDHRIYHPELIDDLYEKPDSKFATVLVSDVRAKIQGYENYPNYIEFTISGSTATPARHSKYIGGRFFFSCAMLNQMMSGLKGTDSIGVAMIKQYPHDFMCIKVIGVEGFYNYSNEPR